MAEKKTLFHLRMDCLHMAKHMLSQKMHMTKEVHGNTAVAFFSAEDVMAEAAKLYRFVCDRDAAETYAPETDVSSPESGAEA